MPVTTIIDLILRLAGWIVDAQPCDAPTRFCLLSQVVVTMRLIVIVLIYLAVRDMLSSGLLDLLAGVSVAWLAK